MAKEQKFTLTGKVVEAFPNTQFNVLLDDSEKIILAHLGGKLRIRHIRVTVEDRVEVQISPYDLTRGIIIRRL